MREKRLRERVQTRNKPVRIVSFYFDVDAGSKLYTRKKQQAAERVGIEFVAYKWSLASEMTVVQAAIQKVVMEKNATGIMVQKPAKKSYNDYFLSRGEKPTFTYNMWWRKLTENIPEALDVDGLSPVVQEKIKTGQPVRVLPATVRAVLKCLNQIEMTGKKVLIVGESDLLGRPLWGWGKYHGWQVELVGRRRLEEKLTQPEQLREYQVIVSATGQPDLIKGEMVSPGVVLVDVGEPQGDVERKSCWGKAAMITPVPGGVGPVTVTSLLENALILSEFDS